MLNKMPFIALSLLMVVSIAISSFSQNALAAGKAPAPSTSASSSVNYSDKQIKAFAAAASEVQQINVAYQPKVVNASQANDTQQLQQLQNDAQQRMVQAIENQGLTVPQYTEMQQALQNNPQMQAKVQAYLK